jgi:DNA-binding NarL/FixJ family response regulator
LIKVLIADDHPVVRLGLRQILADTQDILVGGEAGTAEEALRFVRDERWDIVVLDISLRGGNGIDLIGEIKKVRPETRVLILTVHPEEQYAVRAIKAGAAGFLNKESAPERLTEALKKIASPRSSGSASRPSVPTAPAFSRK